MAMAPERMGIGIRRHFTDQGTHPYEEVTWERRDARITNFMDGAVAFEQLGVEVPSTWSVNATNILAQKYFRGNPGTPEREWSLRQVIDRVADTITGWGVKDGYFVDNEEAEAFCADLKHLVLHQKAAFNSPVWFNIGVRGRPAQASACQPYDALVSTPDGLVPIGRLVESNAVGTKVFDADGITRIVAVKANGTKGVLRIHTKAGHRLDVTPDHLVWRVSGTDTGRFVEAGTLQPGDKLQWHRTESFGSRTIDSLEIAEAALAGWLQSDGFVGQYQGTNRSLTIEAMTVTPREHEWVLTALDKVFPSAHRHERRVVTQDTQLDCRRTRVYGTFLDDFVTRWDLRVRGVDMEVPAQLFDAPLPVVAAYLRSIFQAEGYVSIRERGARVGMDMISEKLVHGVQQLLHRFGIFSRVRFKGDPRADRKGCWSLSIGPLGDRRRFADEIGFIDERKAGKLEASFELPGLNAKTTKNLEIEAIEDLGPAPVYDIQTESGEYLSGNIRVHNCFILSVDDTMDDILNWYVEEGIIFKGGSGAGVNLSRIRSSKERLGGGGTASGPVSFMRGADASAGTIKSGGVTRRAAKMVILDVDHPDVEEFIWCKAIEERKARALRDAGFDMDLDGRDSHSIQYQNANNSVRVTDEFMQAVVDDADWHLRARISGDVVKTVKARDLMRQIAQATWECADPGMQFDTTINRWHTAHNTGRINGSNPCFTGDSLVHTDKGLVAFKELFDRVNHGEQFAVYTHDATNVEEPAKRLELTRPEALMITGFNPVVRLRFDNGMEVRCTPTHRLFTTNRGYVEAGDLTAEDAVHVLDLPAPSVAAHRSLPVSTDVDDYRGKGEHADLLRFPEQWSSEFAHYLGWLVGDGSTSGVTTATIYGSADDRMEILPAHQDLLHWINGDRPIKVSEQANGTAQLRLSRKPFKRFLEALGVASVTGREKRVPWSVQQAPSDMAAGFLRGLFDADGCVRVDAAKGSYVGLGSVSRQLLVDVQRLLTTFGIASHIYSVHAGSETGHLPYTRKDGTEVTYGRLPSFDLRVTSGSIERFAAHIGFSLSTKASALVLVCGNRVRGFYNVDTSAHVVERTDEGIELTYNLSEPRNHSYVVNGLVVRNCSEYMHLDNSACNLASLNLLRFLDVEGTFDVEGFRAATSVMLTAQEILVGNADYPTKKIGDTSRRFRQLGIGYANLGALLMAEGMAYDSDDGRAWAAAITALLTGGAYATSARIAARMGPFAGYHENAEHMLRVLRMHRDEVAKIDEERVPPELLSAAQEEWDTAVELGDTYGVRNSQASVLAPTGCLVGGSLVATDRGLVRLRSLGDVDGEKWQDLDVTVQTDEGPRRTTKFFVNGLEPVVTVDTGRGYRIQGTPQHRVKVVDEATGAWEWKRLADIATGDLVPLGLDQLVGDPQVVPLPPLPEAYWTGEHHAVAPRTVTPELAELVGYFMGDGSLHARGLRFCVTEGDFDVVERLRQLSKEVFGLAAAVAPRRGYTEVRIDSVRVVLWWEACGLAKRLPSEEHQGKGHVPHIPDALLHANDREVYAAFLRGLFEAKARTPNGHVVWATSSQDFARDVQSLLLAIGFPTMRRAGDLLILPTDRWLCVVGFMGDRKRSQATVLDEPVLAGRDGFFYDRVSSAVLGEEELTYDLSVPDNLTYLANGFVSHNTIGLLMDCDTTGIEPDLGLVKSKKLVGGGTMQIVNQTVPRALRRLGYSDDQVADIVAYIDGNKSALGAPHLAPEHLSVFACSMGDNFIHHLGHVRMMAAVQPFISGAISKCVTGDTLLATADGLVRIASLHQGEEGDTFRPEILEVASLDGTQKTDFFYYGGLREVHEVALRSGHRVTGTPNHRLLVSVEGNLSWRRLDELAPGDEVAVQYGDELWSAMAARIDGFEAPTGGDPAPVPAEMTDDLALLLGMVVAAGAVDHDAATVSLAARPDAVAERAAGLWRSLFGLQPEIAGEGDQRTVVVTSATAVAFLDHLDIAGAGLTARVPDAVLRSPRPAVLAFLQGLGLAAHLATTAPARWSLSLGSVSLLDDVQTVLTNLGVVHGRVSKLDKATGGTYDEVVVTAEQAQRLVGLVPFLDPEKAARAAELQARTFGPEDQRSDQLRFSPVVSVDPGGMREVFDLSVPVTKAFVGNGVVNHNTVNLPSEATVEELEQLHIDAWQMGIKALAVYRDNCKVAQPLSSVKKDAPKSEAQAHDQELAEKVAELEKALDRHTVVVKQPIRERLPRRRRSYTFAFRVADCEGYCTVGEYDDGRPGEVFMKVSKQGSTLAGVMDAFSISVSLGLQHGVPLKTYVQKYTNMRFEPAGMTDDADLRIASSLVDYIFRRLAVDYLPFDERAELGILTTQERTQPTLPGVEETATRDEPVVDAPRVFAPAAHSDAPFCMTCGVQMVRAGSCHACPSCGSTSGCS